MYISQCVIKLRICKSFTTTRKIYLDVTESDSVYVPKVNKTTIYRGNLPPLCRIMINMNIRGVFGEGGVELVLRRDSVRPSTISCDSQGARLRLPRQAAAAHSTTSPVCNWCVGWTNSVGEIHKQRKMKAVLPVSTPGQCSGCAVWAS